MTFRFRLSGIRLIATVSLLVLSLLSLAVGTIVSPARAEADTDAALGTPFFETKIRPVLVTHCYECHSHASGGAEGGLRLDTRKGIRQGGDRGPAVVPGDAVQSWLLKSISHADADLKMPPKREKLPPEVIADFTRWIETGAADPRTGDPREEDELWKVADDDFWSYQSPRSYPLPQLEDDSWPRQALDYFVLAQLEERGIRPSPDAPPPVLLRRLYFDLIGLPPSLDDLNRFLARHESAGRDQALSEEVDRLLASPRFGERWGRHWLDVARFAESSGTEANISFPYAWRYRDYVIDRVNEDLPLDRFLTEQIAGDLLPYEDDHQRARLLIATGFLAVGPKNLDSVDQLQFHADMIDEQIDTVSRSILANSIACARCHDHKFDPFSMEDYYSLAGIFASTKTFFGTAVSPANRIGGDPLPLPEGAGHKVLHDSLPRERVEQLQSELAELKAEKAEIDASRRALFRGEEPEQQFDIRQTLRNFWTTGRVEGQLKKVSDTGAALPLTMGVLDAENIINVPLFQRGDLKKPGEIVPRQFPRVLRGEDMPTIPDDQSGRLELAHWLVQPQNPLTSRVLANRVWHHLFGAGIVATVDNFGSTGDPPSHPELLDLLAISLQEEDWSLKRLVRQIVLSRAYRQSSDYRDDVFPQDPENRLVWRVSKRRLEAEAIRDAMLAVSGTLDLDRPDGSLVGRVIGDRPISIIGLDKRLPADLDDGRHRSVYLPVIRDRLPDVLDLFDFAEPNMVTGARETTNVPTQALYLLNSPFVQQRAEDLARRLVRQHSTDRQRVRHAFLLCFGREVEPAELEQSLRFLAESAPRQITTAKDSTTPDEQESAGQATEDLRIADDVPARLIDFCQALLCTGEFRNLD